MDDNNNFAPNNNAPQFQPPPPPQQPYQASPPPPQFQQPQYQPPQQQYQPPMQQQYQAPPPDTSVMTMKDWLLTLLVFLIPCVNIIMMFVWAFGEGNVNRKNFCKAYLIFYAITIVLVIVFYSIFAVAILSSLSNMSYNGYY